MQNTSFENISSSNLKNFLVKLCIVSSRHAKKKPFVYSGAQFESGAEKELRYRIQQLEKELQQTREERDKVLEDNRNKISELSNALSSVKTTMIELLEAKQERVKHLERKIRGRVD